MKLTRRQFVASSSVATLMPRTVWRQAPPAAAAMEALTAAIPLAEADPDGPVYHFRPPANCCAGSDRRSIRS